MLTDRALRASPRLRELKIQVCCMMLGVFYLMVAMGAMAMFLGLGFLLSDRYSQRFFLWGGGAFGILLAILFGAVAARCFIFSAGMRRVQGGVMKLAIGYNGTLAILWALASIPLGIAAADFLPYRYGFLAIFVIQAGVVLCALHAYAAYLLDQEQRAGEIRSQI